VGHEPDTTRTERGRIFAWPDLGLGLPQDWGTILDHELKFGIQMGQLEAERAWADWGVRTAETGSRLSLQKRSGNGQRTYSPANVDYRGSPEGLPGKIWGRS
jgi:hypothetical protein